jgi:hypothetical protein
MAIRDPRVLNKLATLQLRHKVMPYLSVSGGNGTWICHLRQEDQNGEILGTGRGGDKTGAVRDAINKFDEGKVAKNKSQLSSENENLREQVAALKSAVDSESPAAAATTSSTDSTATRKRRAKRSSTPTDVTTTDF